MLRWARSSRPRQVLVYTEAEMSLQERLIEDFQNAKGLKARIGIASEMLKSIGDLTDKRAAVEHILPSLNEDINSHQRTMLPTASR